MWDNSISLQKEYKLIIGNLAFPGSSILPIGLLFFVFFNNFLGLFPYIFTASSHIVYTFRVRLIIWSGLNFLRAMTQVKIYLAHLVPKGTPIFLAPFIVLIELSRNLIRPITLSVRLAANIVAGHLIICLISSRIVKLRRIIFIFIFGIFSLLILLEVAVRIIQSYVISTLYCIYCRENNRVRIINS